MDPRERTIPKGSTNDWHVSVGWICIWAAIMHIILAISNATSLVRLVTRFSGETFGILIAWIYIATVTMIKRIIVVECVADSMCLIGVGYSRF